MELNATLQQEIVKLNKIITVLIEQNDFLKQENADLKNIKGINVKNTSLLEPEGGINFKNNSAVLSQGGINLKNTTPLGNDSDINLNKDSSEISKGGINFKNTATLMSGSGSILNKMTGEIPSGNPAGQNLPVKITPPVLVVDSFRITRLRIALIPYFHSRIRQEYLKGLARELLLLHNNGSATSHEMRKAANLSVSGFAKHFVMLKRKKFIYKQSTKKYALTDHSREILNSTFGKLPITK